MYCIVTQRYWTKALLLKEAHLIQTLAQPADAEQTLNAGMYVLGLLCMYVCR